MSYIDCTRTDLQDDDILRSVLSYDTDTCQTMFNVVVAAKDSCFFTCLNKGLDLMDAVRQSLVLVGTTLCVNVNTL